MQINHRLILLCIFLGLNAASAQSIDQSFIKLQKKAIKNITNGQFKKECKKDHVEYIINLMRSGASFYN